MVAPATSGLPGRPPCDPIKAVEFSRHDFDCPPVVGYRCLAAAGRVISWRGNQAPCHRRGQAVKVTSRATQTSGSWGGRRSERVGTGDVTAVARTGRKKLMRRGPEALADRADRKPVAPRRSRKPVRKGVPAPRSTYGANSQRPTRPTRPARRSCGGCRRSGQDQIDEQKGERAPDPDHGVQVVAKRNQRNQRGYREKAVSTAHRRLFVRSRLRGNCCEPADRPTGSEADLVGSLLEASNSSGYQ